MTLGPIGFGNDLHLELALNFSLRAKWRVNFV